MKKQNRTQPQFTHDYYEAPKDPELTIIHRVIKAVFWVVFVFGTATAIILAW